MSGCCGSEWVVMRLFRVGMRQMVLPSSAWQGKVRWGVAVGAVLVQIHDISTRDSLNEQTFSNLERSSSNDSDHK